MTRNALGADTRKFFIEGRWIDPSTSRDFAVVNPATEQSFAVISLGRSEDVNLAVAAAKKAFSPFAESSVADRLELLQRIIHNYKAHSEDMAHAISQEMGAPITLARRAQVPAGLAHLTTVLNVLQKFQFEERKGSTLMRKEPIGVCGLITPWNWPMNQITCKVGPALAAGCTMVLKPSELAPISALLFAEILEESGVPEGVFNLVNGTGPEVGAAIASHPDVDMVSFTGSTRAGVAVAMAAAPTVKRVTQELGGKSPNIILDDGRLEQAVREGVQACFRNAGQSCNAPTRMLVPSSRHDEAAAIARQEAQSTEVGDPQTESTFVGPMVSRAQFDKVQRLIQCGIDEGATLTCGGTGRPDGMSHGYFVKPTVFSNVRNDMTIAREEIFGPVLCLLPYQNEEEAVRIANETPYGLAAFVSAEDPDRAGRIARRLRAGNVHINNARVDFNSCFGGYKQSGNGREWGEAGLEEFLELKAILGSAEAAK